MRTKTADYFVCKVRYEKMMEDGLAKKVLEQFVVDGVSFTDAEARITEEMSSLTSNPFEVAEIDRAVFKEIFFSDFANDDKWYKAKLLFITIDEVTAKEKKTSVYYLVQGSSLEAARRNVDEVMGKSMQDYVIYSVTETSIQEVFEKEG